MAATVRCIIRAVRRANPIKSYRQLAAEPSRLQILWTVTDCTPTVPSSSGPARPKVKQAAAPKMNKQNLKRLGYQKKHKHAVVKGFVDKTQDSRSTHRQSTTS